MMNEKNEQRARQRVSAGGDAAADGRDGKAQSMTGYHVTRRKWLGGDILSMLALHGGDHAKALRAFICHWPDAEEAAHKQICKVHLYETLEAAREHKEYFAPRGSILAVDLDQVDYRRDRIEGFLVVSDRISAYAIQVVE